MQRRIESEAERQIAERQIAEPESREPEMPEPEFQSQRCEARGASASANGVEAEAKAEAEALTVTCRIQVLCVRVTQADVVVPRLVHRRPRRQERHDHLGPAGLRCVGEGSAACVAAVCV